MKTVLLTGARAPATLELARVFAASGCRVIAADSLRYPLTRFSKHVAAYHQVPGPAQRSGDFLDALEHLVRLENVDLLIPTCEEVFYVASGHARFSRYCRVYSEPLTVLAPLHDKLRFARRARQHGLAVPETHGLKSAAEVSSYADKGFVLKARYSRFSSNVLLPPHGDLTGVSENPRAWLAQAFTPGELLCSYSLARNGELRAHSCYRSPFRAGPGSAVYFEQERHAGALEWVKAFVKAETLSGQFAFDFVETPEGVVAVECNPRATSGVHLLASEPDFARAFWNEAERLIVPAAGSASRIGPALLFAPQAWQSGTMFMRWLRAWRAPDAIFRLNDPLPALLQGLSLTHFIFQALRLRVSLLGASTHDIEWNGPS